MATPVWQPGTIYPPGSIVRPTGPLLPPVPVLTNATFDANATGWSLSGTAAWSATGGFGSAGCVAMAGGVGSAAFTTAFACIPGQTITATCMIATPTGSSGSTGDVNINWFTSGMVFISQSQGNIVNRAGGTGYRMSSVTASAPATAGFYQVVGDASPAGGGTVYFDNFTAASSGGAVPDGLVYKAVQAGIGTSAASEPVWPTTVGPTVVDGGVTWQAVIATRITYKAVPILKSGAVEPTWPAGVGTSVPDGTIQWTTGSRQVTQAPNSKIVVIGASKVFAGDDDIIRYSATVNPLDWTTDNDAGYLPFGLQNYGSNPVAAMGLYRSNLIAFNSESFQMWQIDPDPANMALLDAVPIGSTWHKALSPVSNDLFFLAAEGIRTIGIAGGSMNLQAGDAGMPIDPMIRRSVKTAVSIEQEPLGTYFPSMGQYMLAFPLQPALLSLSGPLTSADEYMSYTGTLLIHYPTGTVTVLSVTGVAGITANVVGDTVEVEWPVTPSLPSVVVTVQIRDSGGYEYTWAGTVLINPAAALTLTGSLPDTQQGLDYNSPLLISNAIGAVTVNSITGTNLPPGIAGNVVGNQLFVSWLNTPGVTPITFDDIEIEDSMGRTANWSGDVWVVSWDYSWSGPVADMSLGTGFKWAGHGHFFQGSGGVYFSDDQWATNTLVGAIGSAGFGVAYDPNTDLTVVTTTSGAGRWRNGSGGAWTAVSTSLGAYFSGGPTLYIPTSPTTGYFVNIGEFDRVSKSGDGKAWTGDFSGNCYNASAGAWLEDFGHAFAICSPATGQSTRGRYSVNGINWTSVDCAGSLIFTYSKALQRIVTGSADGETDYSVSDDGGVTCVTHTFPDSRGIAGIEWVDSIKLFVAMVHNDTVSDPTYIYTSPTGLTGSWTFRANLGSYIGARKLGIYDPDGEAQLITVTGVFYWFKSNISYRP